MAEAWDAPQEASGWNSREHFWCSVDSRWEKRQSSAGELHFHVENIAAAQDFILIDVSDTTNFPHSVGDPTAAYSTPCGEHDMVMSITRSAGSVDVSGTIGYYVEAAP